MSRCPGCGLELPDAPAPPARTDGYRATPECRALYGEVAAYTAAHPVRLARWHQVCVDAYNAQHTGPDTAAITVAFALNGLYLVFERGFTGIQAREAHGYLANTVSSWPRFELPASAGDVTVFDAAMAGSVDEHIAQVQRWGRSVWAAWRHVHAEVAEMTDRQLHGWQPRAS